MRPVDTEEGQEQSLLTPSITPVRKETDRKGVASSSQIWRRGPRRGSLQSSRLPHRPAMRGTRHPTPRPPHTQTSMMLRNRASDQRLPERRQRRALASPGGKTDLTHLEQLWMTAKEPLHPKRH